MIRARVHRAYMKTQHARSRAGKVWHVILMLILGVPIPLILLFLLIRGCVS
jgi:hypothetical protein